MAFFDYLDILPGLEEAYFKIVQLGSSLFGNQIVSRIPPASRARAKFVAGQSYFVQYAPTYDAFDNARKLRWTNYWLSLPFGGHGGANGWPGSGFSGFIYANAPLLRSGQDIELDPPPDTGVIVNGGFYGSSDQWAFNPNWSYSNGKMHDFASSGSLLLGHTTEGGTQFRNYRIEFDAITTTPGTIRISLFGQQGILQTNPNGHIQYTYLNQSHTASPFGCAVVADGGWAGSIDNISAFLLP